MKKYIFSLLVLFTLTAVRCKKSSSPQAEQLPPITTTGANTFGCLVNGNVWLPYNSSDGGVDAIVCYAYLTHNFSYPDIDIYTSNRKNGALDDFEMRFRGIRDTGTYKLSNPFDSSLSFAYTADTLGFGPYPPLDSTVRVKILRCDTIQKIISGTFSFTGFNAQFNKTIYITDGRFDLHYPLVIH